MKIDFLINHKNAIPIIAKWNFEEWGHQTHFNLKEIEKLYLDTAFQDQIPSTIIALLNDEVVGTVSIIEQDCKAEPLLTPWIAALYVKKEYRKQGIGSALIKKALFEVKKLKIDFIYLNTNEKNLSFYNNLEWKYFKKIFWKEEESIIMIFDLKKL